MQTVQKLQVKCLSGMECAKRKVMETLTKKVKGLDDFVVKIIIVVIALAVGVLFRQQIFNFITNFFTMFNTQTQALF